MHVSAPRALLGTLPSRIGEPPQPIGRPRSRPGTPPGRIGEAPAHDARHHPTPARQRSPQKLCRSARPTAAKPPESCTLSSTPLMDPPPLGGGGAGGRVFEAEGVSWGGRVEPHGEPNPANKDPSSW